MASIKIVSGKYESKLSTATKWVLTADESCLFEVQDWIPQAKVNSKGGFTPVTPAEIEKPKGVTWEIKDKSKKIVLATVKGNVLDKFKIAINKKYSGSYGYTLEATLDGLGTKASAFILGSCEAKVVSATWSKQELASDISEIKYGNIVYVTLATEGLNGDNLTFEFYNKKDEKTIIETITQECLNGDAQVKIATFKAFKGDPTKIADLEDFYIKVKNPKGIYIKKGKDDKVVSFQIKKPLLVSPVADVPTNLTPIKVGEPDKSNLSTGIISLEKIAVKTTYDVCNDEVDNFSDFKNFWILENDGKYYHWLKKSLIGITEADDKKKPAAIPITLASTDNFTFKATFKTILPIDGIEVRVRDKDNKYIFTTKPHAKQAKDALYEIEFKSTNAPYKDTVQYFDTFELIFDYSLDKKSWTPLGSAMFCFYLTIHEPSYASLTTSTFSGGEYTSEDGSRHVYNNVTKKDSILETLLYIGCKFAKFSNSADEIVENVFSHLKSLKVERKRNTRSMGYWRDTSSLHASNMSFRGVRYLLKYGEARCGEWASFLGDICRIQSDKFFIDKFFDFVIVPSGKLDANGFKNSLFLVKTWTINDPNAPVDSGGRAQDISNVPLNLFWDHVFVKYNNKYYDPSYGLYSTTSFADDDTLLEDYSLKGLSGVLYAKIDSNNLEIDAIIYKPKAGYYIEPFNSYRLSTTNVNKYRYNTVKTSMEKELVKYIIPT